MQRLHFPHSCSSNLVRGRTFDVIERWEIASHEVLQGAGHAYAVIVGGCMQVYACVDMPSLRGQILEV